MIINEVCGPAQWALNFLHAPFLQTVCVVMILLTIRSLIALQCYNYIVFFDWNKTYHTRFICYSEFYMKFLNDSANLAFLTFSHFHCWNLTINLHIWQHLWHEFTHLTHLVHLHSDSCESTNYHEFIVMILFLLEILF
jgi:hypothetical protein